VDLASVAFASARMDHEFTTDFWARVVGRSLTGRAPVRLICSRTNFHQLPSPHLVLIAEHALGGLNRAASRVFPSVSVRPTQRKRVSWYRGEAAPEISRLETQRPAVTDRAARRYHMIFSLKE